MWTETVRVDPNGTLTLPRRVLQALGVGAEAEVLLEPTANGVLLKSKVRATPITARLAAMNLPVADWETMEQEIEAGREA